MASLEKEVESGLLNLVNSVTGINFYNNERKDNRIIPYLSSKVELDAEMLGNFTGIFKLKGTLVYTQKADKISRTGFDQKFQDIVALLYQDPPISNVLTNLTNVTVYDVKINQGKTNINSRNRAWENSIDLEIIATFKK